MIDIIIDMFRSNKKIEYGYVEQKEEKSHWNDFEKFCPKHRAFILNTIEKCQFCGGEHRRLNHFEALIIQIAMVFVR